MRRILRKSKRFFAVFMAAALILTMLPVGFSLMDIYADAKDNLIEFDSKSEKNETTGITTTETTWSFNVTANTGYTLAAGDTLNGLLAKDIAGKIVLDKGKDLNVKSKSILYVPIKENTTNAVLSITPVDDDKARFVYVGASGSDYKLYDAIEKPEEGIVNSVTLRDINDFAVTEDGGQRYIPLVSGGNFKIKNIKLVESDAVVNVTVNGTITNAAEFTGHNVQNVIFKNKETGDVVTAEVANNSFTAVLPNNYEYLVNVDGDYAVTAETSTLVLNKNNSAEAVNISLKSSPRATISGAIEINKYDYAKAVEADSFAVSLVPSDDTMLPVDVTLTKGADDYYYTYTDVKVAKDVEYTVALKNANDYEVTEKITATELTVTGLKSVAEKKTVYDVKGTAFTSDRADTTISSITFTNMNEEGYSYTFNATTPAASITVQLRDGDYEVTGITTSGAYEAYDHVKVEGAAVEEDIYLKSLSTKEYDLPSETENAGTALTFNSVSKNNSTSVKGNSGASIVVPVSGKQKVTVAGWYSGTVNINGQNEKTITSSDTAANPATTSYTSNGTETSVTINITANNTYLYWIKVETVVEPNPYEAVIEVGEGKKLTNIRDAVAYIKGMERTDDQRVTVMLTDALYREQVVVDTPNVTFNSALKTGSTITWYYGLGYDYYSVGDTTKLYDEARAVDKYYKNSVGQTPGNWGSTVNLTTNASGFKAENITFENSFNRYMTEEELADGIACASLAFERTKDTDVRQYKAKERACTLYNRGADNIEFKDCKFLSSQDTIFTGDNAENSYWVNCLIEGTTDYICGDGNPVFDKCTLSMYSYSDQEATGSYIGAAKKKGEHGYLFYRCKVVTTTDEGLQPTSGNYLMRAWEAGKAIFFDTEIEAANMLCDLAYKDMNEKVKDAQYFEYNTHTPDGAAVDNMSKREEGVTIMTYDDAKAVNVESYFDDWTPTYYVASASYIGVNEAINNARSLNPDDYTNFSDVENAIAAVDYTCAATDQTKVDEMAAKINEAIKALVAAPLTVIPEEGSGISTVVPSEDIVIKTEDGETVDVGKITLVESKPTEEQKAAVEEAIKDTDITKYDYEIIDLSLQKAGSVVKLAGGSIEISLLKDTTVDYTKFDLVIYHLKSNGELEKLALTDKGDGVVSFTVNELSPFVKVYVPKAEADVNTGDGTGAATGDAAPVTLYMMIALLSLATLFAVVFFRKKSFVK